MSQKGLSYKERLRQTQYRSLVMRGTETAADTAYVMLKDIILRYPEFEPTLRPVIDTLNVIDLKPKAKYRSLFPSRHTRHDS